MASSLSITSAININLEEFKRVLNQYPALIKRVSDEKGAKGGQRTLQELDNYRYKDALDAFNSSAKSRPMKLDDIKNLVEWKLRHGKFRPTLMNLVSSNDANDAQEIVKQALEAYKKDADIEAAVGVLTKLRGIGPATASLLLAVHDPTRSPIKYNAKEYRMLCSKVDDLRNRLDVQASDVEKVAYVLMKQPAQPDQSHDVAPPKEVRPITAPMAAKKEKKRKVNSNAEIVQDAIHEQPPLRRSKRVKN
ncbi:hypothetical protein CEK27_001301 [Fusarium fujikuroi]|nr:hypothetical protein CEK27_001301 [Fusarium fujikuroi]QGI76387.1 hypothetical protein CEK25_001293 [Fusarium fujikuroi]